MRRALVVSAGGPAGAAWMLGFIHAAVCGGVELGAADHVVGTSAGALAGGALRGGVLDELIARYRQAQVRWFEYPATLEEYMAAAAEASEGARDRAEAARRVANLEPLGARLVPAATLRHVVDAHLPFEAWPSPGRLVVTAVDAATGRRVAFDSSAGVDFREAVSASCASPGMSELVRIDGRRYADGGLHSPCNADLAAGSDAVLVLVPWPPPDLEDILRDETASLRSADVHLIAGDAASQDAMGAARLSTKTLQSALEAGGEQCRHQIDELRSWWNGRTA